MPLFILNAKPLREDLVHNLTLMVSDRRIAHEIMGAVLDGGEYSCSLDEQSLDAVTDTALFLSDAKADLDAYPGLKSWLNDEAGLPTPTYDDNPTCNCPMSVRDEMRHQTRWKRPDKEPGSHHSIGCPQYRRPVREA